MELKNQELVELTLSEIAVVTGASDPVNPGIVSATTVLDEGGPENNPPG